MVPCRSFVKRRESFVKRRDSLSVAKHRIAAVFEKAKRRKITIACAS